MSYRNTYFRIRAEGYVVDPTGFTSWTSESAKKAFTAESRQLFQNAGWALTTGHSGICDTVKKGKQELYLHPMNFSGVILEDEVSPIRELLAKVKTFQCYHIDLYEEYLDISDEEYLELLESKRDEISDVILKFCKAKHANIYLTGPVAMDIAERAAPRRIGHNGTPNKAAVQFVGGLINQMVQQGWLVTAETDQGLGIRTATESEQRAHNLKESGPAGNMMILGW